MRLRDEDGSATAEYAVVILAAVAFAGVLVAVMRSGEVQALLTELVRTALTP
jgi:Flp pilus assembly pilin Flp